MDRSPAPETVARALYAWRIAAEALAHPVLAAERPAYERAVSAVLEELRAFRSMADLIGCYRAGGVTPRAAVLAACSDGTEIRLVASVVEGTAFWRRVRELVAEAVA